MHPLSLHFVAQMSVERLLNCVLEGIVIALFAWGLLRLLGRRNSGTRFAVWFCALLAIQRAFAIEAADGNRDALRLSGLEPAGIYLGKMAAIAAQLAVLEILLGLGVVLLYGSHSGGWPLLICTCLAATAGIAAAGTLYGVLAAGVRVREGVPLAPHTGAACRPPRRVGRRHRGAPSPRSSSWRSGGSTCCPSSRVPG